MSIEEATALIVSQIWLAIATSATDTAGAKFMPLVFFGAWFTLFLIL